MKTEHKDIEKIILKTADGVRLKGEHRKSAMENPHATIIAIHGFTANLKDEGFALLLNILKCPELDVIAYDTRGHGESEGQAAFGNREYMDIEAAVELALVRESPILLVGVSAGAVSIVNYFYRQSPPEQLAGAMLISSPANWKGKFSLSSFYMAYLTQTKAGRRRLKENHKVNLKFPVELPIAPIDAISKIHVPMALVGGTGDKLLGMQATRLLYEKANSPKRLELAAGAGHGPSAGLGNAVKRGFNWLLDEAKIPTGHLPTT